MFIQSLLESQVIELKGRVAMLEAKQEILLEAITKLRREYEQNRNEN